MENIHILHIDDNEEHGKRLKNLVYRLGVEDNKVVQTHFFTNLNAGYEALNKDIYKYDAIILDAKCVINEGEQDDFDFLPEALRRLEEINQKKGTIHIPFAVNTGYIDTGSVAMMQKQVEHYKGKIFDKSEEEAMLNYLFKEIDKTEITKIEKEYSDVFEVFDENYFSNSVTDIRVKLINIIKNLEDESKKESILQDSRVIQEAIYTTLNQQLRFPRNVNSFFQKNKFLSGNEDRTTHLPTTTIYQTPSLAILASNIYLNASSFGNHSTNQPQNVDVKYWEMPTKYAIKSVFYALLEQLVWFKELMRRI
jgi:CheY-like chemotaxis protein